MRVVDIIVKKREGLELTRDELTFVVDGVTHGLIPEYQASALLMAIVLRGLSAQETACLTDAMVRSGTRVDLSDLPGPKVDKHSTGGVGDKTSLIVAPAAAVCGVVVPMMSGRGLGHTGGTLDKLESIPGFRTALSLDEMKAALRANGCAMIGQTAEIAPADRTLYALRDVTGTVESIPLITASIMSKKIAEGIEALVLDVKTGSGAFMKTEADSVRLARSLTSIGAAAGVRTEALVTAMDAPLGRAVGNALEVAECLAVLRGEGPADVVEISVELAARMILLGRVVADRQEAVGRVRTAIASGAALERLQRIIEFQGGDPRVADDGAGLPRAPEQRDVPARRSGWLAGVDAELVGRASVALGAGRNRIEDSVDHAVGITLLASPGDRVQEGEPVLRLHYRTIGRLDAALPLAAAAVRIEDAAPASRSKILACIT
jgi:pyrimidine-nucleoside phosphorylase